MRGTIALGAALAGLAGCVSLGPRPDPTRYYLLAVEASPADPARRPLPLLGVGPVRLPAYLDRPEIVTRAGPTRLDVASVDRWAAPLDALFTSALAEALRAAVPAREVIEWPWPLGASPEWSVSVEVLRFDREPDGAGVLEGRWALRRGGAVVGQGVTTRRERAETPEIAASVVALSRAVGALARDIAAAADGSRGEPPRATAQ